MPGLDFKKLPAEQVQEIKGTLHGQWQIEANALNKSHFTNKGQFETAVAKLNSKYQQMELQALTELQQQVTEQQRVSQLLRSNQTYTREQQYTVGAGLSTQAKKTVFPSDPGGTPFSNTALHGAPGSDNKGYAGTMKVYAERAEEKPGIEYGPPKKYRDSLISQLRAWQERYGYEGMNVTQKNQVDDLWDAIMREDKAYKMWHPGDVEVKSLRTRGKFSKAMSSRIHSTPMKYDSTPVGRGITKGKPAEKKPQEPKKLPQPNSQKDYDAIPSGSQYMGSDGRVRTKR